MNRTILSLMLFTLVFGIKLRENPIPTTDSNDTIDGTKVNNTYNSKIKVNGTGIELENCNAYAANGMYINFGCTECKSGHKLLADQTGIGVCVKETGIFSCDKSIQFTTKSKITCIECLNGFALSSTAGKCSKIDIDIQPEGNSTEIISNCKQYTINSVGKITCSKCITGYSLSDNLTNCDSKCKIDNCDNCFENEKKQFCYGCKPGFVGIIGYPINSIIKCISAKEWMDSLFSPLVQQFLLH